jgi:hypothetical protein
LLKRILEALESFVEFRALTLREFDLCCTLRTCPFDSFGHNRVPFGMAVQPFAERRDDGVERRRLAAGRVFDELASASGDASEFLGGCAASV